MYFKNGKGPRERLDGMFYQTFYS